MFHSLRSLFSPISVRGSAKCRRNTKSTVRLQLDNLEDRSLLSASLGFAVTPGSAGSDWGRAIATDSLGNVNTAGTFSGTVDFNPGNGVTNLTSAGGLDVYVAKYTSQGNLSWARRLGGPHDDVVCGIAVDGLGNVHTTGSFQGKADFDPGVGAANLVSAGSHDIFVSKLTAAGAYVWAKGMGGPGLDQGTGIALDAAGNVHTTGHFGFAAESADFDPSAGVANLTSAGHHDIFVSKLSSAGAYVWAKRMGGASLDSAGDIAVDALGNVYTTGHFCETADFNPGVGIANLTSVGDSDIFISKLGNQGNYVWAKRIGGTQTDAGEAIALDSDGNVYTTGSFRDVVDFNPGVGIVNLTSAGSDDVFVSKLTSAGGFVYAKQMGGNGPDIGHDLVVDASQNVYVTGEFRLTANFNTRLEPGNHPLNLVGAGWSDVFVVKLNNKGNTDWADRLGGTGRDRGNGIALDSRGCVYVTGIFNDTVDFDPGPGDVKRTGAGSDDIFIVKLRPEVFG